MTPQASTNHLHPQLSRDCFAIDSLAIAIVTSLSIHDSLDCIESDLADRTHTDTWFLLASHRARSAPTHLDIPLRVGDHGKHGLHVAVPDVPRHYRAVYTCDAPFYAFLSTTTALQPSHGSTAIPAVAAITTFTSIATVTTVTTTL